MTYKENLQKKEVRQHSSLNDQEVTSKQAGVTPPPLQFYVDENAKESQELSKSFLLERKVPASFDPVQAFGLDTSSYLDKDSRGNLPPFKLPIQRKENKTGLPDNLKSGVENLSGISMDDVKVHYNSSKPSQLQAHAYAQGTDIHVASGQEKHLPHEAWHVVQQKQGRVKPTMQMQGISVNDDAKLEKEADRMGQKALQRKKNNESKRNVNISNSLKVLQGDFLDKENKSDAFSNKYDTLLERRKTMKESWALSRIKNAVNNYDSAETPVKALEALENILNVINNQKDWAQDFVSIINQLENETKLIIDDFKYCTLTRDVVKEESFGKNPEKISTTKFEILERLSKYGGLKAYNKGDQAINSFIVISLGNLHGIVANKGYALAASKEQGGIGSDLYEFGAVTVDKLENQTESVKVELTEEHVSMLTDFKEIQTFLGKKADVLKNLIPLGEKIKSLKEEGKKSIEAFTLALRFFEKPAGFVKEPIVPLGILPGDVFIRLMSEGNILDDFGAGLQHGEYSHRLQWVAIINASKGGLKLTNNIIDLYIAMNLPPFSKFRTGNSMWGATMDKGTSGSSDTYSAPGTLNRDLMTLAPNFDGETNIGFARWNESKENKRPENKEIGGESEAKKLEPIGEALNEIKKLRLELSLGAPKEELNTSEWKGYGAPKDYMAKAYAEQLGHEGYEQLESGEFIENNPFSSEPSEKNVWKVLGKK